MYDSIDNILDDAQAQEETEVFFIQLMEELS
jgi:hypothetical protein